MEIFGSFARLFEAKSESEWSHALFNLCSAFGFHQGLFAVVPRPGLALEDAFLQSTYHSDWRSRYVKSGMVHFDPTVAHCLKRNTPLVWSPSIFAEKNQAEMYEEACGYGLRSGITLPMHGPNGEAGMLCFVTDREFSTAIKIDIAYHLPQMTVLRDIAFETSRQFQRRYLQHNVPTLTPKERECLTWTATGKSTWEISQILCCSEAAVNFHISNIRRKLNVTSRRSAAVKAVRLGLISLN